MSENTGSTIITEAPAEVVDDVGTPADAADTAAPAGDETQAAAPPQEGETNAPAEGAEQTQEETNTQIEEAVGRWKPEGDLAEDPTLERYKDEDGSIDPQRLGEALINANKLIGGDKVALPKDENDDEGYDRVYDALGRPEDGDQYELVRPDADELPESVEWDDAEEKHWRDIFHSNGMNQKQAQNIWDIGVKSRLDALREGETLAFNAKKDREDKLRLEKGADYDSYVAKVKNVYREFADPEFAQFLEDSGQGNDPRMLRMFERIGDRMAPEAMLQGNPESAPTQQDLLGAIAQFRSKNAEALNDQSHPDHQRATRELARRYEIAYPEQGMV